MKDFDLRKYLAENKLIKEEVYVEMEDDLSEVTVYGFGQQLQVLKQMMVNIILSIILMM